MNREIYERIHKEQIERLTAKCQEFAANGTIVDGRFNAEWMEDCDAYIAHECRAMAEDGVSQVLDAYVEKLAVDYFNDELHDVWKKKASEEPAKKAEEKPEEKDSTELQYFEHFTCKECKKDSVSNYGTEEVKLCHDCAKKLVNGFASAKSKLLNKTIDNIKEQAVKEYQEAENAKAEEKAKRKAEEKAARAAKKTEQAEECDPNQLDLFAMAGV